MTHEDQSARLVVNLGSDDLHPAENLIAALRQAAPMASAWHSAVALPGATLLRQGDPSTDVFVLTEGLVKLVYVTAAGEERIKSLIVDRGLFGGVAPGEPPRPAPFAAVALERSTVLRLPMPLVARALADDPALAAAYGAFSAWVLQRKADREAQLLCDSPETRYRALLDAHPSLVARLKQGDIARYIAVTPVAFSRIKRRVRG